MRKENIAFIIIYTAFILIAGLSLWWLIAPAALATSDTILAIRKRTMKEQQ